MAQKIIEDVAKHMRMLDESKKKEDELYERANKAREARERESIEKADADIISPEAVGFVNGSDEDCSECGCYDAFEEGDRCMQEDVTGCCFEPCCDWCDDDDEIAVLTLAQDPCIADEYSMLVQRSFPDIKSKICGCVDDDADVEIRFTGKLKDLKDIFAMKCGKHCWSNLSESKKREFDYHVMYEDGSTPQTLKEREQLACGIDKVVLDSIGLKPSTANLVKHNTCAISLLEDERNRRLFKTFKKCIQENDFSSLDDSQLKQLENVLTVDNTVSDIEQANEISQKVARKHGFTPEEYMKLSRYERAKLDLTDEELEAWEIADANRLARIVAQDCGLSLDEFMKLTPEERAEQITKSGSIQLKQTVQPIINRDRYEQKGNTTIFHSEEPQFVPVADTVLRDYNMTHRDRRIADQKKSMEDLKDALYRRALTIAKLARGKKTPDGKKDTWTNDEWNKIMSGLDDKDKKDLFNEIVEDIVDFYTNDSSISKDEALMKMNSEILVVKKLFGKRITDDDMAKAMGLNKSSYQKYKERLEGVLQQSLNTVTKDLEDINHISNDEKAEAVIENPHLQHKMNDEFEKIIN
jgi:hypothetical protein